MKDYGILAKTPETNSGNFVLAAQRREQGAVGSRLMIPDNGFRANFRLAAEPIARLLGLRLFVQNAPPAQDRQTS